ncbi:MAG: hypothetical protein K2G87_12100, partial [Oscillospiraceae bacterium]|nr:hypothetical protein [Oscillospiraceae bacterium]
MKLKKLLAAVTAAALAVTTMAVTSFTASADGEVSFGSTENISAKSAKVEFSLSSDKPDWTYKYQNINVIVKTWNNEANAGDWFENGIGGSEQEQWFASPKQWVATYQGTRIDSSFTVNLTEYDVLDVFEVLYVPNEAYDFAITSVKAYSGAGCTGDVVWEKTGAALPEPDPTGVWIKESAGVYYFKAEAAPANATDDDYKVGATKPANLKVPYEEILAEGKTAEDVNSVTASVTGASSGALGANYSGDWKSEKWGNGTASVTIENFDDITEAEFQ